MITQVTATHKSIKKKVGILETKAFAQTHHPKQKHFP